MTGPLNDKVYKLGSVRYRGMLRLIKVESFGDQKKNCTKY